MSYTYDLNLFSDLHKEAYRHRPSSNYYQWMKTATPDQLQAEWDEMLRDADIRHAEDTRIEQENLRDWNDTIDTLAKYAGNRKTAIAWDMDAHGCLLDEDFYKFHWGIPYSTELK